MEHSESIGKIAEALAEFQAEVKDPARDKDNPYFKSKYVAIDGLLAAVRPILAKHGLSVIQSTGGNGQDISVTTEILHTSGEWIRTDALVLKAVKADPQGAGSAVTYGRRYSLSAALGVAWDDDDDGNAASTPPKAEKPKAEPKAKAKPAPKVDALTMALAETRQKAEETWGNKFYVEKAPRKVDSLRAIAATAKELGASNDDIKEVMKRHYNKGASNELTDAEAAEMEQNFVAWVAEVKDDDEKLMEDIPL